MTKRLFRLTYTSARRPDGVDGLDTYYNVSLGAARAIEQKNRDQLEASRAIHGYDHEPLASRCDADRLCYLYDRLVFRQSW